MCQCCWEANFGPQRVPFGPPWAYPGPWSAGGPHWAAGSPGWRRGRGRREDLEDAKRVLEERLADVNAALERESGGR